MATGTADQTTRWELLRQEALGLAQRGEHGTAVERCAQALQAAEEACGPRSIETARCLATLGRLRCGIGETEQAVVDTGSALEIATELLGTAHRETVDIAHQAAVALHAAKRHDEAARQYQQAVDAGLQLPEAERHAAARPMGDLARLLMEENRPPREAEALLRQTRELLETRQRTIEEEPELREYPGEEGEILLNLAVVAGNEAGCHARQQQLAEAADDFSRAVGYLVRLQETFGQAPRPIVEQITISLKALHEQLGTDMSTTSPALVDVFGPINLLLAQDKEQQRLSGQLYAEQRFWRDVRVALDQAGTGHDERTLAGELATLLTTGELQGALRHSGAREAVEAAAQRIRFREDLTQAAVQVLQLAADGQVTLDRAVAGIADGALQPVAESLREAAGVPAEATQQATRQQHLQFWQVLLQQLRSVQQQRGMDERQVANLLGQAVQRREVPPELVNPPSLQQQVTAVVARLQATPALSVQAVVLLGGVGSDHTLETAVETLAGLTATSPAAR